MIGGLEFGSNVHRVIEAVLRKIKLGSFIISDFEDIFDDNWINSTIRTPAENRKYRTAGYDQVLNFINSFALMLEPEDIVSIEEPFDIKINEHLNLIGRYDAVINVEGKRTILDFKTGDITEYSDQLSFYKYTYEKMTSKSVDVLAYNIKHNKIVSVINRDEISLNEEILSIVESIRSNKFIAKPSKYCKDCAYRRLCSDKI
jgi:CRISPR/Cas system-associated exonuclease Cas4 (RecB family)